MKGMKTHDSIQTDLLLRLFVGLGDFLERIAVDPRGCWGIFPYEVELPEEIIEDMISSS